MESGKFEIHTAEKSKIFKIGQYAWNTVKRLWCNFCVEFLLFSLLRHVNWLDKDQNIINLFKVNSLQVSNISTEYFHDNTSISICLNN